MLNKPDPSYHGAVWTQAVKPLGPIAYIIKARVTLLRDVGAAMSPFNAFMFIQGLETMPLRMREHSRNALAVANFLAGHKAVSRVIRVSPQKLNLVAQLIRGKKVATALAGGGDDDLPFAQVIGLHLDGVAPDKLLAELVPLITGFTEQTATPTQVAGRDVIELTDAQGDAPPYAFYAVPVGEDLFLVVASPDLAEDAVGAIPQG